MSLVHSWDNVAWSFTFICSVRGKCSVSGMSRKKTTWDRLKLCFLISWVFLNTKQSLVLALSMIQNTSRRLLQDNRSGKTSKDKMSSDTFCLLQWFMIYHDHSLCCSFWVPFQFNNPLKTFGLKINSPFFSVKSFQPHLFDLVHTSRNRFLGLKFSSSVLPNPKEVKGWKGIYCARNFNSYISSLYCFERKYLIENSGTMWYTK